MKKLFSKEHIQFLRKNAGKMSDIGLIRLFNRHFKMNANEGSIRSLMYRNGIIKRNATAKRLTPEQSLFLERKSPLYTLETLTKVFNRTFNIDYTKERVRSLFKYRKLKIGIPSRNRYELPINSEAIYGKGVVYVKTESKWERKHHVIWESVHGKIPKDHCVIFADRNKNNFEIENLVLVKQNELLTLTGNKMYSSDPEITKTGIAIVKHKMAMDDAMKRRNDGKHINK